MFKIFNIKDKPEYLKEVAELTQKEWENKNISQEEFHDKINKKMAKIINNFTNKFYCKLILLDDKNLIGFISLFPNDCEEKPFLSPWYATMFVKEEYRGEGYSKILNKAILEEAKKRGFEKVYLKTNLVDYFEKLGATYIETLKNGEKLYCFKL